MNLSNQYKYQTMYQCYLWGLLILVIATYAQAEQSQLTFQEKEKAYTGLGYDFFSNWELSGKISLEELGFFKNSLDPKQHNNYVSVAIKPEIYKEWDNGKQSFTFVPFFRYSQHDNRRTHFDVRELTWLIADQNWELRLGVRKEFWGVTEGVHLVDIINQTDLVENNDTEDKLGQPMINLALIQDWGTVDLFLLLGFRDRTYPGIEGRLRSFPEVSTNKARYEKEGLEKHLAYAMRWSHTLGDWDVGLSNFYGMSREPSFTLEQAATGEQILVPYYELINQTGLELQLTYDSWILKHEAIVRIGQGSTFYAASSGIEYTLFDISRSGLDIGFLLEYMYDSRGKTHPSAILQDDFLVALRFAFNDVQSTEVLAGIFIDNGNGSQFFNIEASRRLAKSFKVETEIRLFNGAPKTDPAYIFRNENHIRIDLSYYF